MTMSRAEELRAAGATAIGGARAEGTASTPFVAWPPSDVAWVEGTVEELWEGKYGINATIAVTNSDGLGDDHPVGSKANVGLASATLKDRVTEDHIGEEVHFTFLGWVEPANGNRYRNFEIHVVPEELRHSKTESVEAPRRVTATEVLAMNDEELPF
tara:strand:+ start:172 stop:642 length:471 start_codon:yes stop_codon:yes gene_type:complete